MVDVHEFLSWIWSIGLVCSAAYYCLVWLHSDGRNAYALPRAAEIGTPSEIQPALDIRPIGQQLVRLMKRKESPDDDTSACTALVDRRLANDKGGYSCNHYFQFRGSAKPES